MIRLVSFALFLATWWIGSLFAGARLQALRLGHHHVGDEHLLLCLLSQGDTAAVQVGFVDDSRDLAHIS